MNRTVAAVGTATATYPSRASDEDIADPTEAPAIFVTEAIVGIYRVGFGTTTVG